MNFIRETRNLVFNTSTMNYTILNIYFLYILHLSVFVLTVSGDNCFMHKIYVILTECVKISVFSHMHVSVYKTPSNKQKYICD